MKNSTKRIVKIVAALFIAPMSATYVFAQTTAPTVAAKPAAGELEEIVVTANRRSANLQLVAANVQALQSLTLEQLNVKTTVDIAGLVPGLQVHRAAGVIPFLRGIGAANSGFTTEMPVAMYLDGIYLPNSASGIFSFSNIERIEVLKGPQGTLYGRNSTGGLIHVITRNPDDEPRVNASAGFANYNTLNVNFYGSTHISDTLSANVTLTHSKQRKGWGINVFTGNDNMKQQETGVQAKLLWKPAAGTKITLGGFTDSTTSDVGIIYSIFPGTVGADGTPYLGKYRNASRRDSFVDLKQSLVSLKIEQDVGFANFLSLTGLQRAKSPTQFTQTGNLGNPVSGQAAILGNFLGDSKTNSEELQLSSKPSDSPLEWIAGAFFFDDKTHFESSAFSACVGSVCAAAPIPTFLSADVPTTSRSAYADGTYKLSKDTRLTLGIRYTKDEKKMSGLASPLQGLPNSVAALLATTVFKPGDPYVGNPAGIPTTIAAGKTTYRAVLAHDFSDNVHGYASYGTGFKSGGYNPSSFSNLPSIPETIKAFEVGIKSELLDRRLRLNATAFNYDYTDIQLRSTAPPAPVGGSLLLNAASARIKGLDLDFNIFASDEISINGGMEFLDAKYVSFVGGSCTTLRVITGAVLGGATAAPCDLSGQPLTNAPKLSYNLGITYNVETSRGPVAFIVNDSYKGGYNFVGDGFLKQNAYHLISSSLTWTTLDKHYDVQVFGRNLGSAYYYVGGLAAVSGNNIYVPGTPRTYGVTFGYHY